MGRVDKVKVVNAKQSAEIRSESETGFGAALLRHCNEHFDVEQK